MGVEESQLGGGAKQGDDTTGVAGVSSAGGAGVGVEESQGGGGAKQARGRPPKAASPETSPVKKGVGVGGGGGRGRGRPPKSASSPEIGLSPKPGSSSAKKAQGEVGGGGAGPGTPPQIPHPGGGPSPGDPRFLESEVPLWGGEVVESDKREGAVTARVERERKKSVWGCVREKGGVCGGGVDL